MIDPVKYTALGFLTLVSLPVVVPVLLAYGLAVAMHRLGQDVAVEWFLFREEWKRRRAKRMKYQLQTLALGLYLTVPFAGLIALVVFVNPLFLFIPLFLLLTFAAGLIVRMFQES